MPSPALCLVTDRRRVAPGARTEAAAIAALESWLAQAVEAGVDLIQIRERDLPSGLLVDVARRTIARAAGTATRVVINDRLDVALAAGADGVHLPASGVATVRARNLLPDGWLSRAVHTADECVTESGQSGCADMLVFGTVFPTVSKGPDAAIAGLDRLAAATRVSSVPVVAIGGITPANAAAVMASGAAGIAAIGVFLPPGASPEALGPAAAVAALRPFVQTRVRAC